jgi:hypothetical protein
MRGIGRPVALLGAAILLLPGSGAATSSDPGARSHLRPGRQTTWTAPGARPLSDREAAALVVRHRENRRVNVRYNDYVPTNAQLRIFHKARDNSGTLADREIPERKYVTGRPGLRNPSTDDLIQWVAHKWGIPEDWICADMAVESGWSQTDLSDPAVVSSSWYARYPAQARTPGTRTVYETMGISQVKWRPDGSVDAGTEPLRWQSTAFALDFYAAEVRYFYDGRCKWCAPGYRAGEKWNSIGAWYEPNPWGNAREKAYVAQVQAALRHRGWT